MVRLLIEEQADFVAETRDTLYAGSPFRGLTIGTKISVSRSTYVAQGCVRYEAG